jgi:predicted amidohydrolase
MISNEKRIFKAAAVQAAPVLRDAPVYIDLKATLEKACRLIHEAGANGARLIVFPETFLPTFPFWSLFLEQTAEWNVIWKEYVRNSVEVPSAATETLCQAAREANAYVVMGINELDKNYPGRMYNAALFISPNEGILGTHRKITPTLGELLYHTRGDGGDNLKTYKTELGNLGCLICGEHTQHALIHNYAMQGQQINCSLWPGTRKWVPSPAGTPVGFSLDTEIQIMTRSLCVSSAMYAISACYCIPEDQRPKKFYINASFERRGGSSIVNPMGEYIAGPVYDIETILYADIDLESTYLLKSVRNLTGIYSRWDLFSLAVREKPYEPLIPLESTAGEMKDARDEKMAQMESRIRSLEEQIRSLLAAKEKHDKG